MKLNFSTKNLSISTKLIPFAAAFSLLLAAGKPAKATTFTALNQGNVVDTFTECINDGIALMVGQTSANEHGWQYAVDSPNDGVNEFNIGDNVYEIYSLALRETKDSIWVAINANLPLTGADAPGAEDGNIGWGDLFLNLTSNNFPTANNEGNLFAVRYAETNDSSAPTIGLYGNVTAKSVTSTNSGFNTIQAYNQHVIDYGCQGSDCGPSFGDLPADTSYFDQSQSFNAIASGQFLIGITYLSTSDLSDAGYDLNRFNGQHTIAFKFDKSAICERGYCQETSQSVPEPSGVIGLMMVGLVVATRKMHQRLS